MTVPSAPFGRTGHDSGRVIFGAAALWAMPVEKAAALLDIPLRTLKRNWQTVRVKLMLLFGNQTPF